MGLLLGVLCPDKVLINFVYFITKPIIKIKSLSFVIDGSIESKVMIFKMFIIFAYY